MLKICSAALIALTLSACGGGGGSPGTTTFTVVGNGGGGGSTPVTREAALSFTPSTLTATIVAGSTQELTFSAKANYPDDFNGASALYVFIVDDDGVVLPNANIVQLTTFQYRVYLTTVSTLTVGKHSGNFKVRLCKDSGCIAQFPGSPVPLPYALTITAKP